MQSTQQPKLLIRSDLVALLQLSEKQIDWLISTRQLRPLLICGEQRFDAREVDRLIATYQQIKEKRDSLV